MRIRVSIDKLKRKLFCMSDVLTKTKTSDFSNYICFETKESYLVLKSFNDVSVSDVINDVNSDDYMRFIVEADSLISFLKNKKSDVDIILDDNNNIEFKCGRSSFATTWKSTESFPDTPSIPDGGIVLSSGYFVPVLKRSFLFLETEEFRPEFSRVLIRCKDGVMNVAATDRFKMFRSVSNIQNVADFEFLISEKASSVLYKYASSSDIDIRINTDDRRLYMAFDDVVISDVGLDAKYPDIDFLFKKFKPSTSFSCEKKALVEVLESCLITEINEIVFNIKEGSVVMESSNIFDRKSIKCSIDVNMSEICKDTTFRVNGKNLLSCVKSIVGNNVILEYSEISKMIKIYNPDIPQEDMLCSTLVI